MKVVGDHVQQLNQKTRCAVFTMSNEGSLSRSFIGKQGLEDAHQTAMATDSDVVPGHTHNYAVSKPQVPL